MSVPATTATPGQAHRARFLRPIRLSTLLLLMAVVTLLIGLFTQRIRQAHLLSALSRYRNPRQEALYDALDQIVTLPYVDGAHLDEVLKTVKAQVAWNLMLAKLPTGIPIYVDPIGLQEAEVSLNSVVRRPAAADTLTLGEHLRRILEPLDLGYEVKDGFLMITSKGSEDVPIGDEAEPYLRYRDVLR